MAFEIRKTKQKIKCLYKTLYISEILYLKIEKIAKENNTSFNNVVISMIETCLNDNNEDNPPV